MTLSSSATLAVAAMAVATTSLEVVTANPVSDLIFTGYMEGSSFNKFLQVSALTRVPDLANYQVEVYFNGASLTTGTVVTFPLTSSVALETCQSWIVGDDGESLVDFEAYQYVTAHLWNGNDAIVLRRISDGAVMDSFGQVGTDPGTAWVGGEGETAVSTINKSLCRKMEITTGDVTISDPFNPSLEWIQFDQDVFFTQMDNRCKCFGGGTTSAPVPATVLTASPIQAPTVGSRDVFVHHIQGSSFTSPLVGIRVRVEAIVTGDFQNGDADEEKNLGGFWIQEEDDDADDDDLTSEGVFVLDAMVTVPVDVALGDKVTVIGIVEENFGNTVIEAEFIQVLSSNEDLPKYTKVKLPMDLEAVEGMLVKFDQDLIITEQFQLDRFSEVRLYAGTDRPYQFTQLNTPSMADFQAHLDELASMSIIYEDGRSGNTNDIDYFDGFSPYSTATAPRMGDVIEDLQGVVDYSFGEYRVRSIIDGSVTVTQENERPESPPKVGSGLRIASFNVLNYFITFNERGAEDQEEFDRQQQKLVTALVGLNADIVGLVELENNFPAVLIDLVAALNARLGSAVYSYVDPGCTMVDVSDKISVGFIYKPSAFSVIGWPAILDDTVAAAYLGTRTAIFDGVSTNRASLAVTFQSIVGQKCITIVNNHFKSKGPSGSTGEDADQGDGQGAWNVRRSLAALAVTEWLKLTPTGASCDREMVMGDLNAYAMEDPVRVFLEAGYSNVKDEEDYSYVFDGQIGTLDYILVNDAMEKDIDKAGVWHINEDEADALDYTIRFNRPATYFDGTVPYRCSDHSPVLVGLKTNVRTRRRKKRWMCLRKNCAKFLPTKET